MKRPWLTFCLTVLIFFIAGAGIYREANHRLNQILTRFQETLPAGSQFTYQSASPALLVGGVTLHNVAFHYRDITLHMKRLRLGHPRFLSDGHISLASLLMTRLDYTSTAVHLTFSKGVFRHLLIPPATPPARASDLTTAGTYSLTSLMAFNPEDLLALRFARMHVEGLDLSHPPSSPTIPSPIAFTYLHSDVLTLEGYGLGPRVFTNAQHLIMGLSVTPTMSAHVPALAATLLIPQKRPLPEAPIPLTIVMDNLVARRGTMHWLQRPFRHDSSLAEDFHNAPLQTLWNTPGSLTFNGLTLTLGETVDHSIIKINSAIAERRDENTLFRTEGELRGWHLHLANQRHLPLPLHGTQSTLHFTETSQKEYDTWENETTMRAIIPDAGSLSFNSHYRVPHTLLSSDLLHWTDNLTQKIIFDDSTITFKGQRLLHTGFFLIHPNTTMNDISSLQEQTVRDLNNITSTHPILTPLSDYLLKPQERTLSMTFGDLSLYDIQNLPFTDPLDVLLDAAHLTAAHVQ